MTLIDDCRRFEIVLHRIAGDLHVASVHSVADGLVVAPAAPQPRGETLADAAAALARFLDQELLGDPFSGESWDDW